MATLVITGGDRTTNTNLTTVGTSDYKIEHPTMGNYVTKSGGSGGIGTFSFTGSSAYTGSNFDSPLTVSWTDGTPVASATSPNSRYSYGTIVIPASVGTSPIELWLYCGGESNGNVRVSVVLSDGSATASPIDLSTTTGLSKWVKIEAAAASAGQTVTATIQETTGGYCWIRGVALVAGGGPTPTDYLITPSGGVVFSGAWAFIKEKVLAPSGGVVFSGAPAISKERVILPSGGVVFSGAANVAFNKEYVITPSGGIVFSGNAEQVREQVFPTSGGVLFGGGATQVYERIIPPSGGVIFGGTGNTTFEPVSGTTYTITPSGGISFSGASEFVREKSIVPTGGIVFSGDNVLQREKVIAPSGGIDFSGSANFGGDHVIAPNGGIIFGGSAGTYFVPVGGGGGSGLWDVMRLNVKVSKTMGL